MKQITYEEKEEAAKEYADLKVKQSCGGMNDSDHFIIQFAHMAGQDHAVKQLTPEWIPVTERLPGDETYAIIWRKGYSPEQTIARQVFDFTHAAYCFVDNSLNNYQIGDVVTHWTPLMPEPPKQ